MFRTFRNFPRINDKGNVVSQPLVKTFVADGIGDQSKGVWISPTRTTTTDDGTLHIGLMNPFEGALVTTVQTDICDNTEISSPSCVAVCTQCKCNEVFVIQNNILASSGEPGYDEWACGYDVNPQSGEVGDCLMRCVLIRNTFPLPTYAPFSCLAEGDGEYQCGTSQPPPEVASTILRAVERFVLEMDLGGLAGVSAGSINSATLRLPIKKKSDWM